MRKLLKTICLVTCGILLGVTAADGAEYIKSPDSKVVKSGAGLCWKTNRWTPADATEECDPQYIKKEEPKPVAVSINLLGDTLFDFDKATLKDTLSLDTVVDNLSGMEVESISVVGHTDSTGTEKYNLKLGQKRADAVKDYLVSKGVDGEKIVTDSKGESEPVADNKTREGRKQNRRVTVTVIGTKQMVW